MIRAIIGMLLVFGAMFTAYKFDGLRAKNKRLQNQLDNKSNALHECRDHIKTFYKRGPDNGND